MRENLPRYIPDKQRTSIVIKDKYKKLKYKRIYLPFTISKLFVLKINCIDIFHALTHSRTNVQIHSYQKDDVHECLIKYKY